MVSSAGLNIKISYFLKLNNLKIVLKQMGSYIILTEVVSNYHK